MALPQKEIPDVNRIRSLSSPGNVYIRSGVTPHQALMTSVSVPLDRSPQPVPRRVQGTGMYNC